MELEKGMWVKIYEDPITGIKIEGKAKLIKEHQPDCGDGISYWLVQFEGLGEPEVLRAINIENCEEIN